MKYKHLTLSSLYDEWFGGGEFATDHHGGIEGRNKEFGTKWRKHLNQMQYSRAMRCVKAIQKYAEEQHMDDFDACVTLQTKYEACKCSPAKVVDLCKSEALCTMLEAVLEYFQYGLEIIVRV